jgi:hypothetical protein
VSKCGSLFTEIWGGTGLERISAALAYAKTVNGKDFFFFFDVSFFFSFFAVGCWEYILFAVSLSIEVLSYSLLSI